MRPYSNEEVERMMKYPGLVEWDLERAVATIEALYDELQELVELVYGPLPGFTSSTPSNDDALQEKSS